MSTVLWKQLKEATVSAVQELGLESTEGRVYDQILPDPLTAKYPCVYCTIEDEKPRLLAGTTEDDDVEYPVRVLYADRDTAHRHERQPKYMGWQFSIIQQFENMHRWFRTTYGLPVVRINIEPEVAIDGRLPQYKMVVGGLVLWFWTRQAKKGR